MVDRLSVRCRPFECCMPYHRTIVDWCQCTFVVADTTTIFLQRRILCADEYAGGWLLFLLAGWGGSVLDSWLQANAKGKRSGDITSTTIIRNSIAIDASMIHSPLHTWCEWTAAWQTLEAQWFVPQLLQPQWVECFTACFETMAITVNWCRCHRRRRKGWDFQQPVWRHENKNHVVDNAIFVVVMNIFH